MDNPYEVAVCYVIEPNVPECWRVSVGPPNKLSSRWVDFRGKDAQRLAYEYAAGVLGKKDEPVSPEPPTRDRVIQRLTSSIMYGFAGTTPPYAGQISEYVTGLIDSIAPSAPPSPWISVKAMRPAKRPNGPNTFVLAAKVGPDGCEYIRLGETDGTYWHNVSNGTRLEGVTHWMPLPEPPKE